MLNGGIDIYLPAERFTYMLGNFQLIFLCTETICKIHIDLYHICLRCVVYVPVYVYSDVVNSLVSLNFSPFIDEVYQISSLFIFGHDTLNEAKKIIGHISLKLIITLLHGLSIFYLKI